MCHFNEIDVEEAEFKTEEVKESETEAGVKEESETSKKPTREELNPPKMEDNSEDKELLTT